jgi:hypothetical protein
MTTTKTRDWRQNRDLWIRVLEKHTGEGLSAWNRLIRSKKFENEEQLRAWLNRQQVTGYAQQLLVMERFGYPAFITATAAELIEGQYAGYPQLRATCDAVVDAAVSCGDVIVQARKSFVSLVTPRRTFARIQRANETHVSLGLRLDGHSAGGRLEPSKIHETMRLQITLSMPDDVDAEVRSWLQRAYVENA